MRTGGAPAAPGGVAAAAAVRTRATIASHRAQNPSIGLTGVMGGSAPGAATSWAPRGVMPMSIESTSYATAGRPRRRTRFSRQSRPTASAWTSRAPANAARRARSMWHSRRV